MAEEQPKKKRKKEKEEEKKNMADSSVNKEAEEMIEKALINGKCVISVIGDHAGLSVDENYRGKIEVDLWSYFFFLSFCFSKELSK